MAPRCLKVARSDQTSAAPRGLFGLSAHLASHQSVTVLRENTLQETRSWIQTDAVRLCQMFFANPPNAPVALLSSPPSFPGQVVDVICHEVGFDGGDR